MEHKRGFSYLFGILLMAVSLFMIFKNTYVSSFQFYRFGRVSTGAILIVLLILAVIFAVVRPGKLSAVLIGVTAAALVLSLLLSIRIAFVPMSVLDILLMVVPLAVGAGLVLKDLIAK